MVSTDESCSTRARCVIWHAPGTDPPTELVAALDRRRVEVTAATSAFGALAELCVFEREAARAQAGQPPTGVVLLASPDRLDDPAALVRAVQSYAGRTSCWVYQPGEREPLRAVTRHDVQAWSPAPVIDEALTRVLSGLDCADQAHGSGAYTGGLRLSAPDPTTDDGRGEAASAVCDKERTEPHPPSENLLTDDELAMLLADDEPLGEGRVG